MEFNPAQARRNISIEFVEKEYSKFSVFPVVATYLLDYLHLDREFKDVLKMKNHNHSFSETEYLLFLFTTIFLGIDHLYKADYLLGTGRQLARIRDKFINLAGEILTHQRAIKIKLSDKEKFKAEIRSMLKRQQKLLADIMS